jgi:2-polyprenyl-6-methoxyphenol hydroxylase-like FAD-dependent oxidoreductase
MADHTAYPLARTISQNETERVLTEALAKQGVEIERATALLDLTQQDDTVSVSLRRAGAATETPRCRWVIGCDGAHSAVRKAIGMPFERATPRRPSVRGADHARSAPRTGSLRRTSLLRGYDGLACSNLRLVRVTTWTGCSPSGPEKTPSWICPPRSR